MVIKNGPKVRKHKILRRAYKRKGYTRRAYTRKNGAKVKKTRVHSSKVRANWIKKRGRTVGKYGEIPLKKSARLTKLNYHFLEPSKIRHTAINKAVHKYGRNWVIHRINALRNIYPRTKKYTRIRHNASSDIKYIEHKFRFNGRGERCPCTTN